eukprot:SAG31_NODE_15122_length_769_cov_2.356716_1_plen_194_part_01
MRCEPPRAAHGRIRGRRRRIRNSIYRGYRRGAAHAPRRLSRERGVAALPDRARAPPPTMLASAAGAEPGLRAAGVDDQQLALELYQLDTQGYVVVEHALSQAVVRQLLRGLDAGVAATSPTEAKSAPDGSSRRYPGILNWGSEFMDVVDNARVLPLLHATLGTDCRLGKGCYFLVFVPTIREIRDFNREKDGTN